MADMVNVAVDAMGGDNAPVEIIKGAIDALNAEERVKIFLDAYFSPNYDLAEFYPIIP